MATDAPGSLAYARYVLGGRLVRNAEWVRRDLTEPGWRERVVLRVLGQVAPFVAAGAFVPGPDMVRVALPVLLVLSTLLIAAPFSEEIRDARLRQHGLAAPTKRDRGPPPPESWPGMRP